MDVDQLDRTASNANPGGAHEIRITNHGKMHSWVDFALAFLEEHEHTPIVLHTLPNAAPKPPTNPPAQDAADAADEPVSSSAAKASSLAPSTSTIPRLISVAEIIKREYLKKSALVGLYQYNEVGCLEDRDPAGALAKPLPQEDAGARRARDIGEALSGKKHLRIRKTPYMRVTLSRHPLPDLMSGQATAQAPAVRKMSKSALTRAKRRIRKAAGAVDGEAPEDVSALDDAEASMASPVVED